MDISVCMATFNGVDYISEQIDSIVSELSGYDYELIIVDDCSTDDTVSFLKTYSKRYSQIKIYQNTLNVGHVNSFEKALKICCGDYIFLADQDDIWIKGRADLMLDSMKSSCKSVIFSGLVFFNEDFNAKGNHLVIPPLGISNIVNVIKIFFGVANYWGCSMLLKKDFLIKAIPFNKYVESHDIWLASVGLINNEIKSIENPTIYHRIHSKNKTPIKKRPISKIIFTRIKFLLGVLHCVYHK